MGMIVVNLGLLIGLSIEYRIRREIADREDWPLYASLLCLFASMWLVSSGSIMYFARIWRDIPSRFWIVLGITFVYPLIMVFAARVLKRRGSLTVIAALYALVNYYFLVIYVGVTAYAPLTLIAGAIGDTTYWGARRLVGNSGADLALGLVGGASTFLAYYPFSQYLLFLQWPPLLDERFVAYVSTGLVGAISAHSVLEYLALSSGERLNSPAARLFGS